MNKNLFFLLFIVSISFFISQQASAQQDTYRGKDYIDTNLGNGKHNFTGGLPEWMPDYLDANWNIIYVPYKIHETNDYITYESGSISLTVEKKTCDVKIFDQGKVSSLEVPLISSLSHVAKEAVNGSDVWGISSINTLACNIITTPNPDGVSIKVIKTNSLGDFTTIYNASVEKQELEWTYQFINNDFSKANNKFGFTSTCVGQSCQEILVNGTKVSSIQLTKDQVEKSDIKLAAKQKQLTFDSKNKVHNYLWAIKVQDGKTIMDFTDSKGILPLGEKLIVDPTFGYTSPSDQTNWVSTNSGISTSCPTSGTIGSGFRIRLPTENSEFDNCYMTSPKWNTATIPDDSLVTDTKINITSSGTTNIRNCSYRQMIGDPTTQSASDLRADILNGTIYLDNNSACTTDTFNILDLGTSADTDVQSGLTLNRFAIGVSFTNMTRGVNIADAGFTAITLQVTYTTTPNAPTLTASPVGNVINLVMTPNSLGTAATSYKIDRAITTGSKCTSGSFGVLVSTTGNNKTTYVDSNVTTGNCYSYRIYSLASSLTSPASNISNATLFDLTSTNTRGVPITFKRTDINSTALFLNVTYSNTFKLACNFHYKFAQINKTYTNLTNVTAGSGLVRSDFKFLKVDNEIIDTFCWNSNAGPINGTKINNTNSGKFIITQSNFKLLQQINDFKNGKFGTQGDFGVFDLITLIAIIMAMLGMNRVNESVGGIFFVIIISGLGYFGFIEPIVTLLSLTALVIMLIVTTTKKE